MSNLSERYTRGEREWGDKWDASALDDVHQSIKDAYNAGTRVKVRTVYGDDTKWERTGTVTTTTGWCPAFLLKYRSNAHGSSDLLDNRARVVAVWNGRKYVQTGTR